MQVVIRNLSKAFANIKLFPDVEVKLLAIQGKNLENYEEVECQIGEKIYILRDGYYPILEIRKSYYNNGKIKLEVYYKNGEYHRDGDKPAWYGYHIDGQVRCKSYYKSGDYCRNGDKPAKTIYYGNGQIESEIYYEGGEYYRENGKPAKIKYYDNGKIKYETYYRQ